MGDFNNRRIYVELNIFPIPNPQSPMPNYQLPTTNYQLPIT
ncbi:MAG: hypothetical protein AAF630_02005 [Cyanobacteria bacterium P01_C01_bin.38]